MASIEAVKAIRLAAGAPPDRPERTTTEQTYVDPTGRFRSGYWASGAGRSDIHYQKDEICFLIEGLVRLTDESGHVETYKGGDTFLIPNGFKGVWENVEPVRKIYAIHEPEVK